MSYINVDTSLLRHRKFKKLKRNLKESDAVVIGYLISLWSNVLDLAEDGNITKWSIDDIAEYSNYNGNPETFHSFLLNSGDGFIDNLEGTKLIHDWWKYAGRYLTTKYRTHNPDRLKYIKSLYYQSDQGHTKDIPWTNKIDKIDKIDNTTSRVNKDIQTKIMDTYLTAQNLSIAGDNALITLTYKKNGRAVGELYHTLKDVNKCCEVILNAKHFFGSKGLSWTLETVLKHLPTLKDYKPKKEIKYD